MPALKKPIPGDCTGFNIILVTVDKIVFLWPCTSFLLSPNWFWSVLLALGLYLGHFIWIFWTGLLPIRCIGWKNQDGVGTALVAELSTYALGCCSRLL